MNEDSGASLNGPTFDSIYRREPLNSAVRVGYLLLCNNNSNNVEGNLKRKYFALRDHLHYYESESSYLAKEEPEGCIKLDTFYVTKTEVDGVLPNSNNSNPYDFTVYSYNPIVESYTCRAAGVEELEGWLGTLSGFSSMI